MLTNNERLSMRASYIYHNHTSWARRKKAWFRQKPLSVNRSITVLIQPPPKHVDKLLLFYLYIINE